MGNTLFSNYPIYYFLLCNDGKEIFFLVTKVILFFLFALHLYNFIKFTPYHYTYLNYLSGEANKDIKNLKMIIVYKFKRINSFI